MAAARIADLEAKLSRCVASEVFLELGQQLGLSKLELLGPDGAVDFEFQDLATDSQGPAMGCDLRSHDFLPMDPDAMGERDAIETEIAEDLADQLADRLKAPLASAAGTVAPAPAPHQAPSPPRWSRKTIPVGIFGEKKVDF